MRRRRLTTEIRGKWKHQQIFEHGTLGIQVSGGSAVSTLTTNASSNATVALPDKSGTVAFTDDIPDVDADGYTVILLAADYDVTNNASQNATGMSFSVTANAKYLVSLEFAYSGSDASADSGFDFAVDAGTMNGRGTCQNLGLTGTASANVVVAAVAAANTNLIPCGHVADSTFPYAARATFAFSPSNSTTFRLRWGNNVATVSALSRLCKGAILRYKQVS
jgi:hypothetical protein